MAMRTLVAGPVTGGLRAGNGGLSLLVRMPWRHAVASARASGGLNDFRSMRWEGSIDDSYSYSGALTEPSEEFVRVRAERGRGVDSGSRR